MVGGLADRNRANAVSPGVDIVGRLQSMPPAFVLAIAILPSVVVFLAGCLIAIARTLRVWASDPRRVDERRRTT
jgi:hypothetical protein